MIDTYFYMPTSLINRRKTNLNIVEVIIVQSDHLVCVNPKMLDLTLFIYISESESATLIYKGTSNKNRLFKK